MTTSTIQNDLVYSLPHLYIAGANISAASTTVLAVAPGQVEIDSTNNVDLPFSANFFRLIEFYSDLFSLTLL